MGIAFQLLLNRQSQALHAPAHIRVPGRDPDPDATRNRDHCRAIMASTRASAATSTPASKMTRRSFPISISMRLLGKLRIDDSEHPVGKDHSWNQNIPNEEVLTGCN
jgi:hypothetical protein